VESTCSLKPKPKSTSKSRPRIKINTADPDFNSAGKVRGPYKILAHSRSTPVLGSTADDDDVSLDGNASVRRRRTHLLELVDVLKGVFPEDVVGLGEVEERLGGSEKGGRKWADVSDGDEDEDMLMSDVRGRDAGNAREDPLVHVFVDQFSVSLLFSFFFAT
jgi:hypothetical protein